MQNRKIKDKIALSNYKIQILIRLLILIQIGCSTTKVAIDLNEKKNRNSAIFQIFNESHDLTIGYTCQSYWWSNQYNYDVIAKKGDEWNYYSLWSKKKKNGNWSTLKMKRKSINQDLGDLLINYLDDKELLSLSNDCLNNNEIIVNDSIVRQMTISDGINYKFEIIKNGKLKIIEAYEPEYYLEVKPSSNCRRTFIDWTNKFLTIKKEIST